MAKGVRQILGKFRDRVKIKRSNYLNAVRRHNARIDAIWCDPRPYHRLRLSLQKLDPDASAEDIPEPELPTALFDESTDIAWDDRLIALYLEDNPGETNRPFARGRDLGELELNWKKTEHFKQAHARKEKFVRREAERIAQQVLNGD